MPLIQRAACDGSGRSSALLRPALWVLRPLVRRVLGYSDHTEGATVAAAAVGLGASMVEKHRSLPGPHPEGIVMRAAARRSDPVPSQWTPVWREYPPGGSSNWESDIEGSSNRQ